MPAEAQEPGLYRMLSTIYRHSWPPPAGMTDASRDYCPEKHSGSHVKNGTERASRDAKVNRPFSASLISPRREKTKTRPMSAKQASRLPDAKGLSVATFQKRTKRNSRIPEYDAGKIISESAAARNKALAVEYIAMLQGRNYVKKQYREQYWINDGAATSRPPTGRYNVEKRYQMLYPDLGSVIGSRAPTTAATTTAPNCLTRSGGTWRLSTSSTSPTISPSRAEGDNIPNSLHSESSTTISGLGQSFVSKKSWSNVPSGKCYRVLSHPNDTLASLCLEGRSASRASNSRTSSLSSLTGVGERRRALSSTGESTPSGSSDAIGGKSQSGSGDEKQTESPLLSSSELVVSNVESKGGIESDRELAEVHGIPNAVFDGDDGVTIRKEEEEGDAEEPEDEGFAGNLQDGEAGRLTYSDLEESDISENEADDYDEELVDENEVNRRLQQVSAVFEKSRNSPNNSLSTIFAAANSTSEEEAYSSEEDEQSDASQSDIDHHEYEYPDFLPRPYNEYDLGLFATLPPGMDWRAFLQPVSTRQERSVKRPFHRYDADKRRTERKLREREAKKRKNLEDTIDRLIMLEKLQALTVQFEQDRRRHLIHRLKARSSVKAASSNQTGATAANTANNEVPPQSARNTKRRSSTAPMISIGQPSGNKTRKSLPNGELQSQSIMNKPPPELDLVRLSRNHLQFVRLSSTTGRRKPRFGLPRHYEYSWSERVPPSKRPSLNSLVFMKPRNCPSCRENEKRLAQVHTVQMMLGRPRSAYCTFSSEQQKLHARPNTSNGSTRGTTDSTQNQKDSRLNKDRSLCEKPKYHSQSHDVSTPSTFGRSPRKNSTGCTPDKIFAAQAILSSVARGYARAARRGGKLSRRASAPNITATRSGRSSSPGVIRYRKDANVLKTHVIDSSSLRLK